MLPISLRTAETEQRYQEAKASGKLKDINTLKPREIIADTRILDNYFAYDLLHEDEGDMSLAFPHQAFMEWWMNLGLGIVNGDFDDYDQITINTVKNQSQPHVPHAHLLKFDTEKIQVLRTLYEQWKENN